MSMQERDNDRPDRQSELSAEGIPDVETPLNEFEGMVPPRDYPQGATELGVTPNEERMQEPLADRVRREVPDVHGAADDGAGRLIEPEAGLIDVDDEGDALGSDVGADDGAFSAEEDAVRVSEEPQP